MTWCLINKKFIYFKSIIMSNASSQTTIDINEIKEWAEKRGGKPFIIRST